MENAEKNKMMEDAITRMKVRFRSSPSAPARNGMLDEAKRHAVDVKTGLKTISQIGVGNVAVGAAVYVAHIRQMDAQRHRTNLHRHHHHSTPRGKGMRGVEKDHA